MFALNSPEFCNCLFNKIALLRYEVAKFHRFGDFMAASVGSSNAFQLSDIDKQIRQISSQTVDIIIKKIADEILKMRGFDLKPRQEGDKGAQGNVVALSQIKTDISQAFKNPADVLKKGKNFKISKDKLQEFLAEDMKSLDTPDSCTFSLRINSALSTERKDLVFVLVRTANGKEMSQQQFTETGLELEYRMVVDRKCPPQTELGKEGLVELYSCLQS